MNMEMKRGSSMQLSSSSLRIGGQAEIVLCASLFYFRLPRALWRERMEQVKFCGYNAIDVYFPWNYHELEEGAWDFSGERDAEAFLQLAAEAGLWVVARPGPYICSEWDGGGLPAYLFAKPGMTIRSAEPAYMGAVKQWYDRILPLLARYELGRGGTVICLQLENELDFYDCPDPAAYISELRDLALGAGIEVPLIACAGQGGIAEASGLADGVVPTCNFYPNDRDPSFEEKVAVYENRLSALDVPLLVTETNRSHFLLRRLLSCGAKLLGPYLQVSGTNFGFTNGTNNWGDPLAFMTSDYDFHGMVSSEGHLREEAREGRLLRRIIRSYGNALAEAVSAPTGGESATRVVTSAAAPATLLNRQLRLEGGGRLLFLANTGTESEEVAVALGGDAASVVPQASRLFTSPSRCAILPVDLSLERWGAEGTLRYATAELSDARFTEDRTVIVFHAEQEGEIALTLGQAVSSIETAGMTLHKCEEGRLELLLTFRAAEGERAICRLQLADGSRLELIGLSRSDALLLGGIQDDGSLTFYSEVAYDTSPRELDVSWAVRQVDPLESMSPDAAAMIGQADFLERNGIYRGYAWYEAAGIVPQGARVEGLLVREGSDVVSLYAGNAYAGTCAPGGGSRYLPSAVGESDVRFAARVEIWGHTNFDDPRLPALRLNSMKGLQGIASITGSRSLTTNWRVHRSFERDLRAELVAADCDDSAWAIVNFGGWLSPDHPAYEYYRKRFVADVSSDSFTLRFEGIQSLAHVFVNGVSAGDVHPFDPYVAISHLVIPGEENVIAVFLERVLGLPSGGVMLYEGNDARDWKLSACEERGLLDNAQRHESDADSIELPVSLNPGAVGWLYGKLPAEAAGVPGGWRVLVEGSAMKLTVFLGDTIVGRLWLPGGGARPEYSGGAQQSFYLPGPWLQAAGGSTALTILLEAVELGTDAKLERLIFTPVGEPAIRQTREG